MNRVAVPAAIAFLLAACNSAVREAEAAEKRADIVERNGSARERCEALRDVADAWLKAQDEQKYRLSDLRADIACNAARMDEFR